MRQIKALFIALAFGAAATASTGCSSTSNGDASTDGLTNDGGGDTSGDSMQLFGLSTGDSCFDIVSVDPGSVDVAAGGCMIGVDTLVGSALLVNYVQATATVTIGKDGSLGAGPVAKNMGTLTRDGTTSDSAMPTCTWHQTDTSNLTLTATNQFTLSVTEVENMFAAACGAANTPTGGTCTSSWTW